MRILASRKSGHSISYARRQVQALVRRRHNALVDCAPRLPLEYARHFVSVLSSCTVLDVVVSPRRTGVFLESNAVSTRCRSPRQSTSTCSTRYSGPNWGPCRSKSQRNQTIKEPFLRPTAPVSKSTVSPSVVRSRTQWRDVATWQGAIDGARRDVSRATRLT